MASSRCSVRENASPGSFGQWRGEGREGQGGGRPLPREERGGGAGCWPEGAGGAGLSPGCGGRKGSHPSRQPGLPSPPAGSEGGRQAGAPWAWALEPLAGAQAERSVGGLGCRPGSAPCAPASTSCFARRGRGHFAAGGGRGAELLARRGSGGRGGGGLWAAPALAATRSPLLPRRPALRTGAVGLVVVSPVSCIFALG